MEICSTQYRYGNMVLATHNVLLVVLFWLLPSSLFAAWLKTGEKVELDNGEGLVVFGVDSDAWLDQIDLDRIGSFFSFPKLQDLKAGYSLRVLVLPAGEYQFHRARSGNFYWKLSGLPNGRFSVEAARINYVGEVLLRGFEHRTLSISNHALETRQRLDNEFPGLADRWPWRFANEFPDDYMSLLPETEDAVLEPGQQDPAQSWVAKEDEPAFDPRIPIGEAQHLRWAKLLFAPRTVTQVRMSPSGKHALEYRRQGNLVQLYAIDLEAGRTLALYEGDEQVADAEWLDSQHLVLTVFDKRGLPRSHVLTLAKDGTAATQEPVPGYGYVLMVDPGATARLYMFNSATTVVIL